MFFKDQAWKEKNGDNSKHFPLKVKKGTNLYLKLLRKFLFAYPEPSNSNLAFLDYPK